MTIVVDVEIGKIRKHAMVDECGKKSIAGAFLVFVPLLADLFWLSC